MNRLADFFYNGSHRVCQKWDHYFEIYEECFAKFVRKDGLRFLEIGVSQGGSLQLWRDYFGPTATIVGVDIEPTSTRFNEPEHNTFVRVGSQSDPAFLEQVAAEFGPFDIILDDGGHTMEQQITSFETLFKHLKPVAVYMVEDCHTSYHTQFGGGLRQPGTFIEFAKVKIDEVQGFHIHSDPAMITSVTHRVRSIRYYDSIVAFCLEPIAPPSMVQTGR